MRRLLLAFLVISLHSGCSNREVERLEAQVAELESQVEEYRNALTEANDNIEQAANDIGNAKLNVFGDCESLGFAVQMMDEPATVDEP